MEHAGMFDYILSSEQISFFNGCVSQRKAELWTGICLSTPSPGPLAAPRDTCLSWVYLRWPGSLRGRPVLNSHAGPRCPVRLSFPNKTCLRILGARSRPCVEQRWHFTDRVVPPARLLSSGWTASISWTQSPSLSPLLLFHWVPLCVFFFDPPPPDILLLLLLFLIAPHQIFMFAFIFPLCHSRPPSWMSTAFSSMFMPLFSAVIPVLAPGLLPLSPAREGQTLTLLLYCFMAKVFYWLETKYFEEQRMNISTHVLSLQLHNEAEY